MKDLIIIEKDLVVRKIEQTDAEAVFKLIDDDRENLRKWLPFVDVTVSSKNTLLFIQQLGKACSRELVFVMLFQDEIVGLIGFKDIDNVNRKLEIGYWIVNNYEGRGIVSKCCEALIRYAFHDMDMNRIQIKCAIGNKKSSNIPKRLNFKFEGIERAGEKHQNKYFDLEVYALLRGEGNLKDEG